MAFDDTILPIQRLNLSVEVVNNGGLVFTVEGKQYTLNAQESYALTVFIYSYNDLFFRAAHRDLDLWEQKQKAYFQKLLDTSSPADSLRCWHHPDEYE